VSNTEITYALSKPQNIQCLHLTQILLFWFGFGGSWVWTQGLALARQVLYHLSCTFTPRRKAYEYFSPPYSSCILGHSGCHLPLPPFEALLLASRILNCHGALSLFSNSILGPYIFLHDLYLAIVQCCFFFSPSCTLFWAVLYRLVFIASFPSGISRLSISYLFQKQLKLSISKPTPSTHPTCPVFFLLQEMVPFHIVTPTRNLDIILEFSCQSSQKWYSCLPILTPEQLTYLQSSHPYLPPAATR
jgi:hypothetical protein